MGLTQVAPHHGVLNGPSIVGSAGSGPGRHQPLTTASWDVASRVSMISVFLNKSWSPDLKGVGSSFWQFSVASESRSHTRETWALERGTPVLETVPSSAQILEKPLGNGLGLQGREGRADPSLETLL